MIKQLKGYLQQRQYLLSFINNCIHQAIQKSHKQKQSPTIESPPKKFVFIPNPDKYIDLRNPYYIDRKRRKLNLVSGKK